MSLLAKLLKNKPPARKHSSWESPILSEKIMRLATPRMLRNQPKIYPSPVTILMRTMFQGINRVEGRGIRETTAGSKLKLITNDGNKLIEKKISQVEFS